MENLTELFNNFDFYKKLKPKENFPLSVHWSNSSDLTKKIRESIKNGTLKSEFNVLNSELEKLKDVPMWLKLEDSILKLTAFDLYHTMCLHFRNGEFEDQLFNSQDVSFISPAGPFRHLSLVECVHSKTIESFVYRSLIQNNLPQRSFRVNTKGHALLCFGEFHEESVKVSVEQITESGILFCSDNFKLLEVIDDAQYFKIQMTTENLDKFFTGEDHDPQTDLFFTQSLTESFKVNSTSLIKSLKYDSADTGNFYLFCRYHDIKDGEHGKKLNQFVSDFRDYIKAA